MGDGPEESGWAAALAFFGGFRTSSGRPIIEAPINRSTIIEALDSASFKPYDFLDMKPASALQDDTSFAFPSYWPSSGWRVGWYGDGHEADNTFDFVKDKFQTARLSRSSEAGQAIVKFMSNNLIAKSYTAPTREKTRMNWAETMANDEKLSDKWRESNRLRMMEGKRGGPKPPSSGGIRVDAIIVIKNKSIWDAYCNRRQEISDQIQQGDKPALRKVRFTHQESDSVEGLGRLPVLDPKVGEVALFHGTSKAVMKLIAVNGFDPKFCKNKGSDDKPDYGALGKGVYFSDCFAKVMTYTTCWRCGSYRCDCVNQWGDPSKRVALLSRVVLGVPKNKRAQGQIRAEKIRADDESSLANTDRHSIYGKGVKLGDFKFVSGSNEFVTKSAQQMYPEFVIYWSHA